MRCRSLALWLERHAATARPGRLFLDRRDSPYRLASSDLQKALYPLLRFVDIPMSSPAAAVSAQAFASPPWLDLPKFSDCTGFDSRLICSLPQGSIRSECLSSRWNQCTHDTFLSYDLYCMRVGCS
jgi:hypothetical protein